MDFFLKKSENGIRNLHFQMNGRSAFPWQFSGPLCHSTLGEKERNAKLGNGVLEFIQNKENLTKSLIFFCCCCRKYQKGLGKEWRLQRLREKRRKWRVVKREFGSERRKGERWNCAIERRVEEVMLAVETPWLRITKEIRFEKE